LYVAWDVLLSQGENEERSEATVQAKEIAATAQALRDAGARPWLRLSFSTPAPLEEHGESLNRELETADLIARAAGEHAHFQILWRRQPPGSEPEEYARLFQRATAVLAEAHPGAPVITRALDADPEGLHHHRPEVLAEHGRGIALAPRSPGPLAELEPSVGRLAELGPRRPVVVDALPWPDDPRQVLVTGARSAEAKLSLVFFRLSEEQVRELRASDLTPLKLLAREFQGGGFLDQRLLPQGAEEAWSFVHGEAGRLRTVVVPGTSGETTMLRFSDPHLGDPVVLDLATGEPQPVPGIRRTEEELLVPLAADEPVAVLVFPEPTAGSGGG
jgi:hypothetical protein